MKTYLESLEKNALLYPNKIAFADINLQTTYSQLIEDSKKIATTIINENLFKEPIVLYFEKNVDLCKCMIGCNYSGNFYVVIDTSMPNDRVLSIFETLKPKLIICADNLINNVPNNNIKVISYSKAINCNINYKLLTNCYNKIIDTDLCYAIFTSGSTGKPKGTVINHNSLLKYLDWYISSMKITNQTIFGGQTPFYFSGSVSDFFSTIVTGATYHIIPKSYFMFPIKLVEFLNDRNVNTLYWVPSALAIFSILDVFKYATLKYVCHIMFLGEVMHVKYLNYLKSYLPNCRFTNMFGPTETVDICTYYDVDRDFSLDESLPIGKHADNIDTFILKENNTLAKIGEIGELCVRGSFLASGYYNMEEKTKEVFCQNPLQHSYPELIYKTGDLVYENEKNEYIYVSRKDFQIKHMGYRIELGEIESAITSMDNIRQALCIYDSNDDNIVLIYEGKVKKDDILQRCNQKLPPYMVPNVIVKVSQILLNANGKKDCSYYKNNYKNLIEK